MAKAIQEISQQFLRMYPLKDMNCKGLMDHISTLDYNEAIRCQQQLIGSTLHHPAVLQYPPALTYCQRFLKLLITKIEELNYEVCDELYTGYTRLISQNSSGDSDNDGHCYRTYCLEPDLSITLKETQKIISEGTTGMFTWQASHVLADWCQKESDRFCGRRILELGSGLGLTGLTVIKKCQPKSFIFTDLHTTVLKTLKTNVDINLRAENSSAEAPLDVKNAAYDDDTPDQFKITYEGTDVYIDRLDWMTDNISRSCDVILAADVVYDTDLISPLVDTMKDGLTTVVGATAYVASTIRNPETFDFFRETLAMKHVKIVSESRHTYQESPSQPSSTVVLVQLTL